MPDSAGPVRPRRRSGVGARRGAWPVSRRRRTRELDRFTFAAGRLQDTLPFQSVSCPLGWRDASGESRGERAPGGPWRMPRTPLTACQSLRTHWRLGTGAQRRPRESPYKQPQIDIVSCRFEFQPRELTRSS